MGKYSQLLVIWLLPLALFLGCADEYYSLDDYSSVKKTDIHVHINEPNSGIARQAAEDNFRLVNVNVDIYFPDYSIEVQRDAAIAIKENFPENTVWLTAFSMDGWDDYDTWLENTLTYLEESFEQGAIGLKIWKNIGMEFQDENGEFIMIDHPGFDPIFEYLIEKNKPVLGHLGEPREAWLPLEEMKMHRGYFSNNPQYHMYLHPEYPSYESIMESRDNRLDKHPGLVFVGAHLGSMEWSLDVMSEHLERYPNVALEMAARMRHIYFEAEQDWEKTRDFFITYQDQLIYSTDLTENPGSDPAQAAERAHSVWMQDWEFFVTENTMEVSGIEGPFRGLKLPKPVVDKLFSNNAETWFPPLKDF